MLNDKQRILLIILTCFLVTISAFIRLASRNKGEPLIFNEIDAIYEGAPIYYPDERVAEISEAEANEILGINISECIPDSIQGSMLDISKSYFEPAQLRCIDISIHNPNQSEGKTLVVSTASRKWSERSTSSIDYVFSSAEQESSQIGETMVDAFVRPAFVDENIDTGYRREEAAVYIGQFQVAGLEYYIEGRNGITQEEFSEFIINVINSYV